MVKGSNDKYYRKHVSLKPEIYKEFIKQKGKVMQKTGENFSDSSFIEYLIENVKID